MTGRRVPLFVIGTAVQAGALLMSAPALTRLLDRAEFGAAALIMVIAATATGILDLGLAGWLTRSFSMADGRSADILRLAVVTVLITTASASGIAVLFHATSGGQVWLHVLLGICVAGASALNAQLLALCRATGDATRFLRRCLLMGPAVQTAGVIGVLVQPTATAYGLGAALAAGLFSVHGVLRSGMPPGRLNASVCRAALSATLPSVPHALTIALVTTGPRLVLATLAGAAAVGEYQLGVLVSSIGAVIIVGVNNVWAPAAYRSARPGEYIGRSTTAMLDLALLLSLPLMMSMPVLLTLIAGHPLSRGAVIAASVLCLLPASQVTYLAGMHALYATGRTKVLAAAAPGAAAIGLGSTALLVPVVGTPGAALGAVYASLAVSCTLMVVARRVLDIQWRVGAMSARCAQIPLCLAGSIALTDHPRIALALSVALAVLLGRRLARTRHLFLSDVREPEPVSCV